MPSRQKNRKELLCGKMYSAFHFALSIHFALSTFDFRFFLVLVLMFFRQFAKIIHADGFFAWYYLGFGPIKYFFS